MENALKYYSNTNEDGNKNRKTMKDKSSHLTGWRDENSGFSRIGSPLNNP